MDANNPFQPLPADANKYGEPTLVQTGLGPAYQYMTGYDSEGSGIYEYGAVPSQPAQNQPIGSTLLQGPSSSFAPPVATPSIDDVSYGPSWANQTAQNQTVGGLTAAQPAQNQYGGTETLYKNGQMWTRTQTGEDEDGDPIWRYTPSSDVGTTSPIGGLAATTVPSTTTTLAATTPPPTTTTAGTSIFGPSATVVGNTMYTSDGKIITNPIVSDYQQYGLTAPKNTPTVSKPFSIYGNPSGARAESLYTGIVPEVSQQQDPFNYLSPRDINPYAAFGTGQDIKNAYLTTSGDIVLPGGRIVRDPTAADYDQYGIRVNKEFSRSSYTPEERATYDKMVADASTAADKAYQDAITNGADQATATQISQYVKDKALRAADTFLGKNAYTTEESNVYNQIIKTGNSAADILYQSAIANGIDKRTANEMADSVRNNYQQQAIDYRGSAYLPGDQVYKNFYTKTAEEFLGDLPEEQRSFRPTAEQIFNSLPADKKAGQTVENVQTWLNNNPDYKVQFTPQMIQEMANNGAINLGTKLVGVNYDSLAKDDPVHLKAINEATNKFNLGLNLINDWGLMQGSKSGKTSTGVSVQMASAIAQGLADGIVTPEEMKTLLPNSSGRAIKEWTEFGNDMAKLRGDKDITTADLQEIAKGGKAPKLVKGTDDIYTVTTSGGKKGGQYIILKKTGDDSYQIRGGTSSFTPTGGNFWSKYLPVLAGVGLALIPGMQGFATQVGTALGAGTAYAPVVGGAVLGAGKSALFGGDPLMGALTGGAGAAASSLVNSALSPNAWHAPMVAPDAFSLTNPQVIGGLSQTAGNVASNLVAGNPIIPSLASGLINTGVNASFPAISTSIQSALPAGTPNILGKSITGGLIGSGVGALTGMDPLASGAMGAVSPLINYGVQQTGLTGVPANMFGGALAGATRLALQNQDPTFGAAAGALAPIVSYGFDALGRYIGLDQLGRPVTRT